MLTWLRCQLPTTQVKSTRFGFIQWMNWFSEKKLRMCVYGREWHLNLKGDLLYLGLMAHGERRFVRCFLWAWERKKKWRPEHRQDTCKINGVLQWVRNNERCKLPQRWEGQGRSNAHAHKRVCVCVIILSFPWSPCSEQAFRTLCVSPCLQFLLSAKSYVFSCDCRHYPVAHLVLSNENKQLVTALTTETNKDI